MKTFLKKNWLVILVGGLSAFLGVLTLMTAVRLKTEKPVAPTVPQKKPEAVTPACTLTFKLSFSLSPTPTRAMPAIATPTAAFIAQSKATNTAPFCHQLLGSPTLGETPLTVTFTGSGADLDGKITAFEFSFGDREKKIVAKDSEGEASHSIDYTYSSPGSYLASLRIKDDDDALSIVSENCQVEITVLEKTIGGEESTTSSSALTQAPTSTPTVSPITTAMPSPNPLAKTPTATATPIPVPKVPEAGISLPTMLTILCGSLLVLLGILL